MSQFVSVSSPRGTSARLLIALILLPAAVFYAALFVFDLNLPFLDDYDAGLNFANTLISFHTFHERLLFFLASQHNEYKLYLGHAFVWLQLALTGHINFAVLSVIGNFSIAFVGLILWKMFLPSAPLDRRLKLFLPVSLLLFQLQYAETLDWALPGLQNTTILAFTLGAFLLLAHHTRASFAGALACMILGICASGNGFFMVPIGILILLFARRFVALALWIVTFALCAWAYAFHYVSPAPINLKQATLGKKCLFLFGFLGSAAQYKSVAAPILVGALLCLFIVWMISRGYALRRPAIAASVLFILITAVGVARIRAGFALETSVSSRYRVYSDLLVIFAWFAIAEQFLLPTARRLRNQPLFVAALGLSFLFFLRSDLQGIHYFRDRDRLLVQGLHNFESSAMTRSPVYLPDDTSLGFEQFRDRARKILIQSEANNIYRPKQY